MIYIRNIVNRVPKQRRELVVHQLDFLLQTAADKDCNTRALQQFSAELVARVKLLFHLIPLRSHVNA
jgi:hypothetical protein